MGVIHSNSGSWVSIFLIPKIGPKENTYVKYGLSCVQQVTRLLPGVHGSSGGRISLFVNQFWKKPHRVLFWRITVFLCWWTPPPPHVFRLWNTSQQLKGFWCFKEQSLEKTLGNMSVHFVVKLRMWSSWRVLHSSRKVYLTKEGLFEPIKMIQ